VPVVRVVADLDLRGATAIHRLERADQPHTFCAAVGAVNELVTAHVLERGAESQPELSHAILGVHLALLVGGELAQRIASYEGA
jgi:hypothetical protein